MEFGYEGVCDMTMIKNLLTDTSGASAAEYALILAIVGTGIAVAAYTLGTSISGAMNKASNCITNSVNGVC
jgi:pilus assembly protein Flp/PilA